MKLTSSLSRKLVLLAPCSSAVPTSFRKAETDWSRYVALVHEMQRFRGAVYLEDGAIQASQLIDGRHHADADLGSWHLLVLNNEGRVCGCARYHEHSNQTAFSELGLSHAALAKNQTWVTKLEAAIEAELRFSRILNLPYVELGGWALGEEIRGSTEALRIALATYSLSRALGGALGISTVTRRYCSSSILRRLGGRSVQCEGAELPAYYDPQYNCEMEVLRFYSWAPNPRYAVWIEQMGEELSNMTVLSPRKRDGLQELHWRDVSPLRSLFQTAESIA